MKKIGYTIKNLEENELDLQTRDDIFFDRIIEREFKKYKGGAK